MAFRTSLAQGLPRELRLLDRRMKGDKNGMMDVARVSRIELLLPPVEQWNGLINSTFIRQIIGPPAIGIDITQVLIQPSREQTTYNREVLVMRFGKMAAIGLRFLDGNGRKTYFRAKLSQFACQIHCGLTEMALAAGVIVSAGPRADDCHGQPRPTDSKSRS